MHLALKNLQRLICHKTQPTKGGTQRKGQKDKNIDDYAKSLHARDNIDCRNQGNKDFIDVSIQGLEDSVKKGKERLQQPITSLVSKVQREKQRKRGNRNRIKTTVWIFQATKRRYCPLENLDMHKKEKSKDWNWISTDHIYQPLRSGRIWHTVNF